MKDSTLIILINDDITSILALSFNQPKFCPIVSWQANGTTVADNTSIGPSSIIMFIDTNNTIYVSNRRNNQVRVLYEGNTTATIIISTGLYDSHGMFVATNGDIYLDNGQLHHRVDKWSKNSASMETVMYVQTVCYTLFVDTNNSLYCSLYYEHRVVKRSLLDDINSTKTIAGNGTPGNTPNMLNLPTGIFVHTNFSLYVADHANHRIQLFHPEQSIGITVVGSESPGGIILANPTGIIVDANDYLYIANRHDSSILRFGLDGVRCVVGCTGSHGSESNQLNAPFSISFDTHGNIFVLDENNDRIQKFLLSRNYCGK